MELGMYCVGNEGLEYWGRVGGSACCAGYLFVCLCV